jgi:hypothetical protein
MPDDETLPSVAEETPPLELKLDETALPPATGNARQIAAANITDTLPPTAYIGASTLVLSREEREILEEPVPDDEIDIRPDGLVYVSHEYVRRQLNRALGHGQWALVPGSKLYSDGNDQYQRWVLFCRGVYVSEALASRRYYANGNQTRDDVAEAIKSDCLRRCCKDLGIGLEAWNRRRQEHWRREHAIGVLCSTSQGNKKQWRRIDGDPLNGEISTPVKSAGVEEEKGREKASPAPPVARTAATPPPQAPQAPPAVKSAPTLKIAPKSESTTLTVTDSQVRLLWTRALGAMLVVGDDAEKFIDFLHENCMIDIPARAGKKSKETAAHMARQLPAGAQFQKLIKTLEIMATQNPVEI